MDPCTHAQTADPAYGYSRHGEWVSPAGRARAELSAAPLSCLEMIQGHPDASRGAAWDLNLTQGLRDCGSIFMHLFLYIFSEQGQLTFRATLGSKDGNFHRKSPPLRKELDTTFCPCLAQGHTQAAPGE